MNKEIQLINLLLNKEYYIKYNEYVDLTNVKELNNIYNVLSELHSKTEHNITPSELEGYFYARYPETNNEVYSSLFNQINNVSITEDIGLEILAAIKRNNIALKLSEKAYAFTQGFSSLDELDQLSIQLLEGSVAETPEEEFVTTDLELLVNDVVKTKGLRWRLDCLNKSLGSLRKGDFGFLFARPETGKTTFLASEISSMLDQTDKQIIWFN